MVFVQHPLQLELYKDGAPTDQIELSEANQWHGTFEDLDVNAAGKALNYTVKRCPRNICSFYR